MKILPWIIMFGITNISYANHITTYKCGNSYSDNPIPCYTQPEVLTHVKMTTAEINTAKDKRDIRRFNYEKEKQLRYERYIAAKNMRLKEQMVNAHTTLANAQAVNANAQRAIAAVRAKRSMLYDNGIQTQTHKDHVRNYYNNIIDDVLMW